MKRVMLPFALLMTLTSCSRMETAVKWADWMIIREVDSYFDISDEQNKKLKADIQTDIGRLKKENFPEVAAFLRRIASDIENDRIDRVSLDTYHTKGMNLFQDTIGQFSETATDFSFSATDSQIDRFTRKYKKKTENLIEDLETEKDRYRMQKKRYSRWIDTWLDDLNREQEKALEAHLHANPFPWDLHIKNRDYTLNRFLEVRKNKQKLKAFLSDTLAERDPTYREAIKSYQVRMRDYIFELYKSLDQEQKDHLIKQLRNHAMTLERIVESEP